MVLKGEIVIDIAIFGSMQVLIFGLLLTEHPLEGCVVCSKQERVVAQQWLRILVVTTVDYNLTGWGSIPHPGGPLGN